MFSIEVRADFYNNQPLSNQSISTDLNLEQCYLTLATKYSVFFFGKPNNN